MVNIVAPERATVLVSMSPELVKILSDGYRLEGGTEIRWEFGERGADGFYEPSIIATTRPDK